MKIFKEIEFFFQRPKVILVAGNGKKTAKEAISKVLNRYFKIGKEIVILDTDAKDAELFLKRSRLPILVATHIGEYHPDREFFAGEMDQALEIEKLAEAIPAHGFLVLNFDDETIRDIKNKSIAHPLTFGFGSRANVSGTDIVLTQFPSLGTNFKINNDGNIVPCWLENLFGKENIYAALAAAAVGLALDLNLVEISEALKGYGGLLGRMKLAKGIKKSLILDDAESASSLSMLESLRILKQIGETCPEPCRRVAVLGDIVGIGKYAIEAHEALGEEIKNSADLLVTVGERAKFFSEGAKSKGMAEDKIFQFSDVVSASKFLQSEIKEGDLILVDGSKEMSMIDIVKEIEIGPIV
ncbi:MAG: hypothetical protein HYV47_03495 [Candidatus Nealsonbacteria bacterium]|nr:hypothetical protein [Candidatus Nealsonbacteria bacterium]